MLVHDTESIEKKTRIVCNLTSYDVQGLHKYLTFFCFVAGEKSTGDEQMACAMLAIQLDNFLGGEPIQHRHVQGYETPEFMALFPRGVSYKVMV